MVRASFRGDEDSGEPAVTGPAWQVGGVPPESWPREIDRALDTAARPFLQDGYVATARAARGVQLARPRRMSLPGRIVASMTWFFTALLGGVAPIAVATEWNTGDPLYLWVDRDGVIRAVREQVLRPLSYRA